ncbi:hypothetical protein [Brevibacillus sp. SKDU10]|nr:hypothetical protein [Brevibacillus sp. SKDU10]
MVGFGYSGLIVLGVILITIVGVIVALHLGEIKTIAPVFITLISYI